MRMFESQHIPQADNIVQGQTKCNETHKSRQLLISPAPFFDSLFLFSLLSCISAFLFSLSLHCIVFQPPCSAVFICPSPPLAVSLFVCLHSLCPCSQVGANPTCVCAPPGLRLWLQATLRCLFYFKSLDRHTNTNKNLKVIAVFFGFFCLLCL